ncbi:MAG: hypothetical protein IPK17_30845 [Chloroflexi bacterium]|uniref:hypothetical protein n=1 Tax=Candidatus Flexifilum breve TaxID=3140694 RepID=UPI0031365EB3|nr:hypothetical protein [Chloroflexota bacterium]
MDDFQHALDLDVRQELEAAAHAYEQIIAQPDAPLDAYLNLACLYWRCIDFEFTWSLNLEIAFIWRAGERVWQVLDAADAAYPDCAEIRFWRAYFRLTTLDRRHLSRRAARSLPNRTRRSSPTSISTAPRRTAATASRREGCIARLRPPSRPRIATL